VLLVGAGLLVRGFLLLQGVPTGLSTADVLTANVAVPDDAYPGATLAPRLLRPVLERVRQLPGVRSAGVTTLLPIQQAWSNGDFTVEGEPAPAPGAEPWAEIRATSPGFFESLGIPLRAGRPLDERDDGRGPRAVLVNETAVRRYFRGPSPVGRRIVREGLPFTVVGVVGDVRSAGLDQRPLAELYFSYADSAVRGWMGDVTLVVKTTVPPASLAGPLREAVRAVDRGRPLYRVMTMDEVVDGSLADRRLNLVLLGLFAGVAVVLTAVGLYGVIAYLVAQRTREMGIRMALGARAGDVVGLVMRQGMRLAALGVALGLVAAVALTRVMAGLLYGVAPRDPVTFGAVAALLAAVALLATYVPARRASRADPMLAIRSE
jgi:predicted permease